MKTLFTIIILVVVGCSEVPEDNTIKKDGKITDEEFKRLQDAAPEEDPEDSSEDKKKE